MAVIGGLPKTEKCCLPPPPATRHRHRHRLVGRPLVPRPPFFAGQWQGTRVRWEARSRPFGVPTTSNPTVGSDRCAPRDSRSTRRTKVKDGSEDRLRPAMSFLVAIPRGLLWGVLDGDRRRSRPMATGRLGFPTPFFAFWLRETRQGSSYWTNRIIRQAKWGPHGPWLSA
ncbi:hypothetical protein B296_00022553 [Ensete ventricosum]|uniref:Uncharacterized protein n=1 Tax=Ensete ventricosum TaxID=4639 RepID=A0A426XVA6_ENSVE|nr:hypothetical protein B296_00022553 [Ensete ventricosum]